MSELPDQDPRRGQPAATRARTGGQPNESIQPANARGRVVIDGSATPSTPDAETRARYTEQARRERAEMGWFGHVDAAMRSAANTMTFGYADRLAAGGDALFGSGEGATLAERYRDNRLRQEAITQADSEVHSTATQVGQTAAELLPYERGLRLARGGERILRRFGGRGRGRACRQCSRRPVALADGVKVARDVDFELPGLPLIELSRVYAADLDFDGPLGRNRIGVFDEAIVGQEDGALVYLMGSGLEAEFARPSPNPGEVSRNARHPYLALSAAAGDMFEIRRYGVVHRFARFAENVWLLMGFADAHGNGVTLARDADGLLTRADRTDGFAFVFENDARGLRVAVTLHAPSGETRPISRFAYDERENLVEARNGYRPSLRYEYDAQNRFTAYEDGVKVRNDYAYDDEGRVVRVSTPGGRFDHAIAYRPEAHETTLTYLAPEGGAATTYVFDDNGRPLRETDPLGHVTTYERDAFGELLAEIDPEGNRTSYGYDAFGARAFVEDAEGRRTSFHHDSDGRLERQTDASGASWDWGYDERGALVWARDPLGHRTDFVNDAAGLPTGIMRHDGLIERRDYDAQHRLVRLVDFRGGVTRFERDAFGRVVAVTDPMGHVVRFNYEERAGADFWTASTEVRADGVSLRRIEDSERSTLTVIDGEGRRTVYGYGPFDLLEQIDDSKGGRVRFIYDHDERLVRVENQRREVWTFERDAAGRTLRETDFAGLAIDYSWDRSDRAREIRYADGARVTLDYDRSGLVTTVAAHEPDSVESNITRYAYDARGMLAGASNLAATVWFERDPLGRIIAETANGRRIESTYTCCGDRETRRIGDRLVKTVHDPLGAVQRIMIDDRAPLTFVRDKAGRERNRQNDLGFELEQAWDALGQLTRQKGTGAIARVYGWDRAHTPTSIVDRTWGDTAFVLDDGGQIAETRFDDGRAERFDYDQALDLVGAGEPSRVEPFLISSGGRVRQAVGPHGERIALEYDVRGRVIERRIERDGFRAKRWRYVWDARDKLARCVTPSGERWVYDYDPFGRRVSKRRELGMRELAWARRRFPELASVSPPAGPNDIWPEPPPGASELDPLPPVIGTAYLWDGDVVAEETPLRLDGASDPEQTLRWHYEPKTFRPLAREGADGTLLYVVTDHLGTPRELVGENGDVVWAAEHYTWGEVRRIWLADNDNESGDFGSGPSRGGRGRTYGALALRDAVKAVEARLLCPIRFQGQWDDDETGLYYNRFRSYDPSAARYVSSDPLGLAGGLSSHAYVECPTLWIDALGLKGVTVSPAPKGAPYDYVMELQRSAYPETAGHIEDAIRSGQPDIMTPDRIKSNVARRRRESLKKVPCCANKDRDEWPMAMSEEGGTGASVRPIDPSDNRGAGKSIGSALSSAGVRDGQRVKVRIVP